MSISDRIEIFSYICVHLLFWQENTVMIFDKAAKRLSCAPAYPVNSSLKEHIPKLLVRSNLLQRTKASFKLTSTRIHNLPGPVRRY